MLSAPSFEVTDVGCDVPVETFVAKVKDEKADLLLLSALLTTSEIPTSRRPSRPPVCATASRS